MNLQLDDNHFSFTHGKKEVSLNLNHQVLKPLVDSTLDLVNSLKSNNFDWKANNNVLVFNIINQATVFVKKYKKLTIEDKKELCFKIIERLIEKEIKKLEMPQEQKMLIQNGVDTILEPMIEFALLKAFQTLGRLAKLCPCLK